MPLGADLSRFRISGILSPLQRQEIDLPTPGRWDTWAQRRRRPAARPEVEALPKNACGSRGSEPTGLSWHNGAGPKLQLRAGPGQTRHELELPSEFEGKSPVDLHKSLAASDPKKYIVAQS